MPKEEVRYQMLRPDQVVARRTACPVAYVPLGNLEWHGVHNPLGADTLQAEGMAILCARKGGGLAMPPLWYGEMRTEGNLEATSNDSAAIAERMQVDPEGFSEERFPFPPAEQAVNYHKLLLHILAEVESLGFALGVLVAGHYPLIDHARSAVLQWNQRWRSRWHGMRAWAMGDWLLVEDRYDCAGDHAGGWETSHLMHLHPRTVDISLLPPKPARCLGAGGRMDPRDATAAFGREILEAAAEVAVKEVRHRLDHMDTYRRHGHSLDEQLWRE